MVRRLEIPNFGSFSGFDWKSPGKQGQDAFEFKRLNILFGRNYSGKTTLSRIFQSLELGRLPQNYPDPAFKVVTDGETLTPQNISSHHLDIRVYNTDFVTENLSFLIRDDGEIRPFAVIGSENKEIEKQIQEIEEKLGDEESNTGMKYELARIGEEYSEKKGKAEKAKSDLKKELSQHANDKIKLNRIYGKANYIITSINRDINTIRQKSITTLEASEVEEKKKLLRENPLPSIKEKISFTPNFTVLYKDSMTILAAIITPSDPIRYLLEDSMLQAWVREGMDYHRGRESCGFCGQYLPRDFWEKLDAHFSQESSDLEKKIQEQIQLLEQEIESSRIDLPEKGSFYNSVYSEFRDAAEKLKELLSSYRAENRKLLKALKARGKDLFATKPQPDLKDLSGKISHYICKLNKLDKLVERNNRLTHTLAIDQERARVELRLNDVLNFINRIGLNDKEQTISELEKTVGESKDHLVQFKLRVRKLEEKRDALLTGLRDEKRGAEKVNEYLNHSFGLDSLKLVADEDEVESTYKFQIMRGDQPAYNMSEGERSLISFCYFLAKLEGTETEKDESIIYIDDPASSLDSNHIFFLFSLIESVLTKPKKNSDGSNRYRYKQLFISTHNLDFLKYLKRLSAPSKRNGAKEFFLVEKEKNSSSLRLMPKYLKDYQTEFIYLFHQIYKCREVKASEDNHQILYSLGNNLRKFLEAYLFYKYPHIEETSDGLERLRKFFGDDETTTALANRINNELSHLEAIFDRGMRPLDIPELSKVVSFVLNTIKEKDQEQYNSLLESIGEPPENKEPLKETA